MKKLELNKLIYDLEQLADQSLQKGADIETRHGLADSLLLEYIGNNEVITAFNRIEKYYA